MEIEDIKGFKFRCIKCNKINIIGNVKENIDFYNDYNCISCKAIYWFSRSRIDEAQIKFDCINVYHASINVRVDIESEIHKHSTGIGKRMIYKW